MPPLDILIPCKGLAQGKSRLSSVLSTADREELCRLFLVNTIDLALALGLEKRVFVVTPDTTTAAIAACRGAGVVNDAGGGLNSALREASAAMRIDFGSTGLLVLPTDLPLASTRMIESHALHSEDVVIAPDRTADGTNLMRLAPHARRDFDFHYGPGSFSGHVLEAVERGLSVGVILDTSLACDIDTAADLVWLPR
jgi:2-phospho-L-lactate/phosphoenolpyruvate guanylyltransferase